MQLSASTGAAEVDHILREIVTACEAGLAGRVRGYYLIGSYAEGCAVAISDIDLIILCGETLTPEERAQADDIVAECTRRSSIRLDAIVRDEATLGGEAVLLRYGALLIYGADTRGSLALPPLAHYTRETLDAARDFLTRVLRGAERLTYPLTYPDPDGEFFGYDTVRIPEWYPPGTEHGVKELVATASRIARAALALRAGRYSGSKAGSVSDYGVHIGDEWSGWLAELYTQGKLRWGYQPPANPDDRRELRALCRQMLAFENDFLARYREYLLALLRAGDAKDCEHARTRLDLIAYPDEEVRSVLHDSADLATN